MTVAGMAVRGCRQAGLSGGGGHGRPAHAICGVCGAEPCSPGPREGTAALQRLRVHGVYTCGVDCVCACACVVRGVCVRVCASCACGTRPPFEHLPRARSRGQLTGAITGWLSGRCRLDRFSLSPLRYRSAFLLSPQLLLGVGCRRQVQAGPLHSAAARSGVSCPPPGLCAAGRRGVLPPGRAPSCPAHGRDLTSGLRAQARPGWGRLCAEVGLGG